MCNCCDPDYENLAKQCAENIAELEIKLDLGIADKNGNDIKIGDYLHCNFKLSDGYYCNAIYEVIFDSFYGIELKFIKLFDEEKNNQTWFSLSVNHGQLSKRWGNGKSVLMINEKYGENHLTKHRWLQQQESYDIEIFKGDI